MRMKKGTPFIGLIQHLGLDNDFKISLSILFFLP